MGNSRSCLPAATSAAAASMACASFGSRSLRSAFARAAACLMRPKAAMKPRGMVRPLIGKFSTARWVWAPQSASAGTLSSPMLSRSVRKELVMRSPRDWTPASGRGRRTRPRDRMRYHYKPSTPGLPPRMTANSNESLAALDALSPVDGRYRTTTAALRALLSEAGLIRERVRVEAAWLLQLAAAAPQLPGAQLPAAVQTRL